MKRTFLIISLTALLSATAFTPANAQQAAEYEVEYQTPAEIRDFRIAVGGGYAYRLGRLEKTGDAGIDDLNKKLMHGFNVDADAQYFFKETWGLGLNANLCSTSTSGGGFTNPADGQMINNYRETQRFLFAGPSFATRAESEKFLLVSSIGIGPLFFMNDITVNGIVGNGSRTTVGFNLGVAGEYKLNHKTGLGLKLSYTLGTINSVNLEGTNIKYDEPVSVSNLMVTAFLSFRTW